jgi:hypothetical protein
MAAAPADVALEVKGNGHTNGNGHHATRTPLDEATIHLKAPGGYATLLRAMAERMPPTPALTINYKDITCQVEVPVRDPGTFPFPLTFVIFGLFG